MVPGRNTHSPTLDSTAKKSKANITGLLSKLSTSKQFHAIIGNESSVALYTLSAVAAYGPDQAHATSTRRSP